jgi:anti-anti-sigma regulatory factor
MTLRITRRDGAPSRATLRLEGRLVAAWAPFVERECATLLRSQMQVDLDLSGVRFVDGVGVETLARLSGEGIEIRGCTVAVASVLEGEGIPVTRDADGTDDVA